MSRADADFSQQCDALAGKLTALLFDAPKAVTLCVLPGVMAAIAKTFEIPRETIVAMLDSALEEIAQPKLRLTGHCIERFQERVAPNLTRDECRAFLKENVNRWHKLKPNPGKDDGSIYATYRLDPYRFALIFVPKKSGEFTAVSVMPRSFGRAPI